MMWESKESTRCGATLSAEYVLGRVPAGQRREPPLQCSLAYDHENGHVYVTGSWVADRHAPDEGNGS